LLIKVVVDPLGDTRTMSYVSGASGQVLTTNVKVPAEYVLDRMASIPKTA